METQNITLAVPKKVLAKFKEIAFRQQKSISKLMTEMMENAVTNEEGYHVARDRHAAGFELLAVHPATLQRHQTKFAERHRMTARRQPGSAATVHLAELHSCWLHCHNKKI